MSEIKHKTARKWVGYLFATLFALVVIAGTVIMLSAALSFLR